MKTIKTVEITPVYAEFMPEVMENEKLYISKEYECAIHLCLCGCKGKTVTPLTKGEWVLIENGDKVSLTPSISNYQMDCKSHYIITNNKANFV